MGKIGVHVHYVIYMYTCRSGGNLHVDLQCSSLYVFHMYIHVHVGGREGLIQSSSIALFNSDVQQHIALLPIYVPPAYVCLCPCPVSMLCQHV